MTGSTHGPDFLSVVLARQANLFYPKGAPDSIPRMSVLGGPFAVGVQVDRFRFWVVSSHL